jgi:hypothetical protein
VTRTPLTECPFCEFEVDFPHEDVKTAPEKATHRVHRHVENAHPNRTDELSTYTSPR